MDFSFKELKQHYCFIPCHKRKHTVVAMADRQDRDLAFKHVWGLHERHDGGLSPSARVGGHRIYLRLLIAQRAFGPPPENHVCEHLNGDLMDCRRSNLKYSLPHETQYQLEKRKTSVATADGFARYKSFSPAGPRRHKRLTDKTGEEVVRLKDGRWMRTFWENGCLMRTEDLSPAEAAMREAVAVSK